MSKLIDDLLNFALIGRRPLHKQSLVLWDVVRAVLHELPHSPSVVYEVSPDELRTVQADPALLKQVLTNLLGNALKFSRTADPPRIQIGCERRARRWCISSATTASASIRSMQVNFFFTLP